MDINLKDIDEGVFDNLVNRIKDVDKKIGHTKVFHGYNGYCLEKALLGHIFNLFVIDTEEDQDYLRRIVCLVLMYENSFYTHQICNSSRPDIFKDEGMCGGYLNYEYRKKYEFLGKRKEYEYYNELMKDYGMCGREEFYSFDVLITMHRIYKDTKDKEYRNSEKIMFHCLLFLSIYDKYYEENLERISAFAKNLDFTAEEMEDLCLAVNTFIDGEDIFNINYKTLRIKEIFN